MDFEPFESKLSSSVNFEKSCNNIEQCFVQSAVRRDPISIRCRLECKYDPNCLIALSYIHTSSTQNI